MALHEDNAVCATVPSVADEVARGEGISLSEAAKMFPRKREGKPVSPQTVGRWCLRGARRHDGQVVRLEAVRWNRSVFTSRAAIARFIRALAAEDETPPLPVPPTGKAAEMLRREEEAALRKLGL